MTRLYEQLFMNATFLGLQWNVDVQNNTMTFKRQG